MDTKKLRQKILDLAIHGKLVPQDPNDEPASVLLERIRAEKEQLIKEGKIKAPKKSKTAGDTSHYGKDGPWTLPEGWQWSTLGEICSKVVDGDHNPPPSEPTPTEYLMISSKNVLDNCLDGLKEGRYLSRSVFEECNKRTRLEKGDILLTTVGTLGRSCIFDGSHNIVLQRSVSVLTPLILSDYVKCYLDSGYFQHYIDNNARGTAQKGFYLNLLEATYLPIPPLNEQRQIVGKAYSLLSELGRIDNETSVLNNRIIKAKNKILDLALKGHLVPHDPADVPAIDLLQRINPHFVPSDNLHYIENLPKGWCFSTIGDIFQHNTGKALNGIDREGVMRRYITTSNLYWDRFDLSEERMMPFTEKEQEKCRAQKGDLLVCEGGDIGRAAIWPYEESVMIQNHIHRLRPRASLSVRFFYYIFYLYKQKGLIGGKGIGIQGLSSRELDKMVIPVPPVNEQHRIVTAIEEKFAMLDAIADCC